MVPALFVANYVIEYSNKRKYPINNLRLQKLLYFINARSLVETGKPIFSESIQKWKYGPVVPEVYHEYKQYGAFNIDSDDMVTTLFCFDSDKNPFDDETDLEVLEYTTDSCSSVEKQIIEATIDTLSRYGVFALVDETHAHSLWKRDEEKILRGEQGIAYSNEEVREYFQNHPEEQIWLSVS